jgi:hypothetical protein
MKALKLLLESEGIDTSSLRVLFEQDGAVTFALTETCGHAVDLWERLRALVPKTKRWPLLVGRPGEEELPTDEDQDCTTADILEAAEQIDARALLNGWHEQGVANTREEAVKLESEGSHEDAEHFRSLLQGEPEYQGIPRGKWPRNPDPTIAIAIGRPTSYGYGYDEDTKPVTLALLPTAHGWEAPAVMKFGGWNANPPPPEHVALLRYWRECFGADLVVMTNDVIEMMVAEPPRTRKEAMHLARDQYHYCEDIVEQGTYTLEALAGGLLRGEAWYFWWD